MNLTITNDMIIKYIAGGVEHTLDKLVLNENGVSHDVYDGGSAPVQPSYTEVTEIKMSNPVYEQEDNHFMIFDTGVAIPDDQDLWVETTFSFYESNGDLCFGVDPTGNYSYRVFYSDKMRFFDYYKGRLSGGFITTGVHTIKFGKNNNGYITMDYDGTVSTGFVTTTFDYAGRTFWISITSIGIRNCKIWSDNQKTTLLFDGKAVLDENSTPCLYDSVSGNFIYMDNKTGYTGAGTLTYIP